MVEKTGKSSIFVSALYFLLMLPTTCPAIEICLIQKVSKAGDGALLARALLSSKWRWSCSSIPSSDHLRILGMHTCRGGRDNTDCCLRISINPQIQNIKAGGILGLFRHISESSDNYKKSTKYCRKLILFLAFWAVKSERSPGADYCPLTITVLPFNCYFHVTSTAVSFCSWATELAHPLMLQPLPLWHPHPPSPLQTRQVNWKDHKHFLWHGPKPPSAHSQQHAMLCFRSLPPCQHFISKAWHRSTITFPHRSDCRIRRADQAHFQTIRTAAEETEGVVTFHHSTAPARAVLAGCCSRQDLLRKEPVHWTAFPMRKLHDQKSCYLLQSSDYKSNFWNLQVINF